MNPPKDANPLFDSVTNRIEAALLFNYSGLANSLIMIPIQDCYADHAIENPEMDDDELDQIRDVFARMNCWAKFLDAAVYSDAFGGCRDSASWLITLKAWTT